MTTGSTDLTTIAPHRKTAGEVLSALRTDAERGLTQAEAERRHAHYGANELDSAAPRPEWRKFLDQFLDVLVLLLIAAAGISAAKPSRRQSCSALGGSADGAASSPPRPSRLRARASMAAQEA